MIVVYLSLTIAAYIAARMTYQKYPHPLLTPVFSASALILLIIYLTNITLTEYESVASIAGYILEPATVAFAIPVYKYKELIWSHAKAIMGSLLIGTMIVLFLSLVSIFMFQFTEDIAAAVLVKTTTVPIALELAISLNGHPSLTVLAVMLTGLIGAVAGPHLMTLFRVHDPIARGLAMGSIAHGIGTAHILQEGDLQGAASALAMALAGIFLAVLIGVLY